MGSVVRLRKEKKERTREGHYEGQLPTDVTRLTTSRLAGVWVRKVVALGVTALSKGYMFVYLYLWAAGKWSRNELLVCLCVCVSDIT